MKNIFLAFALIFCGSAVADVSIEAISFEDIVRHNADPAPHAFFGPKQVSFSGWNHTANDSVFEGLAQDLDHYEFKLLYAKQPHSTPMLAGILVKKLGNWNQQHSNGLEFPSESPIAFKDVKYAELFILINAKDSTIPNQKAIKKAYKPYADKQSLNEFAKSEINISLGLYSYFSDSEREPSYNAEHLLTLNMQEHADEYLSIRIPIEEFRLYTEQNYASSDVAMEAFGERVVQGIRVMGESSNKKVLRNYNGAAFEGDAAPPELFKEVSISLLGLYLK